MKKLILLLSLITGLINPGVSQDIPLYSQKLTNSFLYNPAVAGNTFGSITYAYQQSYSNIPNAPKSNFLSFHAPLNKHKFGFGVNLYQEDVNFLRNTYLSTAFAYHIRFNKTNMLSMGVSGEYNMLRLNGQTNSSQEDPEYQKLANGSIDDIDFSAGLVFQTAYYKIGLSSNRLATAWFKDENSRVLSNYYTGFVQGMIPLRGGNDILEPYVTYRKFSNTNNSLDIGLYYTYNNRLTGGAAWRSGGVVSLTAGVRITPKVLIGYSREIFLGDISKQTGATNQFTLRFDFNEYSYKNKFVEAYKASLSYRRKVLSRPIISSKSPEQFHKKQKKFKKLSPNKRYQAVRRPKHHYKQKGITPKSQQMKRR